MAKNDSFAQAIEADPRFRGASVGSVGQPNDSGVVMVEDQGDGLVLVTDRDGRKYVETLGDKSITQMDVEVQQKAADLAIENSPVVNEASEGHSAFDGRPGIAAPEVNQDDVKVVNTDLGVDAEANSDANSDGAK